MANLQKWEQRFSVEDLKRIVENKGYNGFCLAKNGHCYFKKVVYKLASEHTTPNKGVNGIWIFEWSDPSSLAAVLNPTQTDGDW